MTPTVHCHCGATRAEFHPTAINWQGLCHCGDCRRSTGAPVVGWFGVANGSWAWAGAPPQDYISSPGVTRHFCGTCGTSMGFYSTRWPDEIHFLGATLENPEDFKPTFHVYRGEHLPWLNINDSLKTFNHSTDTPPSSG